LQGLHLLDTAVGDALAHGVRAVPSAETRREDIAAAS
jgi:hypothetical protein